MRCWYALLPSVGFLCKDQQRQEVFLRASTRQWELMPHTTKPTVKAAISTEQPCTCDHILAVHAQTASTHKPNSHSRQLRCKAEKQHKRHKWQHLCHDALSVYTCVDACDMQDPASAWQASRRLANVMCPPPAATRPSLHMLWRWHAMWLSLLSIQLP